ncbi:hypothetical protein [Tenacibaculum maritimum]|uniref:hypothetical protein n=1 Tax=Tenacibaculum maritimum TaxID=107401 RepID=UPI000463483D|nr:hypothetical protein [Tenacibaculum maritimum]
MFISLSSLITLADTVLSVVFKRYDFLLLENLKKGSSSSSVKLNKTSFIDRLKPFPSVNKEETSV